MAAKADRLIIATRGSALARRQTEIVADLLRQYHPNLRIEILALTTHGDQVVDQPLPSIGGKGLFTQDLESALREGRADLAVHSLKDLPVDQTDGLILAAIPRREDAREVLVANKGQTLESLPSQAIVGTSSLRRQSQLMAKRPDLQIRPIRGNVETRLTKVVSGDYQAAVLAAAGLIRLKLQRHAAQWFELDEMLPAPGQAALAVQCREEDDRTQQMASRLDHTPTRLAVLAERTFLRRLEAGCSAPVAAYAHVKSGQVHMQGLVASVDGQKTIRVQGQHSDPVELGRRLAEQALQQGAHELVTHDPR